MLHVRRLALTLVSGIVMLGLAACSDSDSAGATIDGPRDLLLDEDARDLLGQDVEQVDFVEFVERESEAIPDKDRTAVENAAERNCVYEAVDGDGHDHGGAVSVVLNDAGDSFALAVYRADVDRAALIDMAEELTTRYAK